jgi:hypothetical protein
VHQGQGGEGRREGSGVVREKYLHCVKDASFSSPASTLSGFFSAYMLK